MMSCVMRLSLAQHDELGRGHAYIVSSVCSVMNRTAESDTNRDDIFLPQVDKQASK